MRIATVEYNSKSVWPDQNCDVIYVGGSPFYEHPRWSPWPALFLNRNFNDLYDIDENTDHDNFRVITGGEPFLQSVELFAEKLKGAINCPVRIDTDGAFPGRLSRAIRNETFDHIALRIWAPISKYHISGLLPANVINDSLHALETSISHEVIVPYDPNYVDLIALYNSIKDYDIEQITIWPLDSSVERLSADDKTSLTKEDLVKYIDNQLPNDDRIVIL